MLLLRGEVLNWITYTIPSTKVVISFQFPYRSLQLSCPHNRNPHKSVPAGALPVSPLKSSAAEVMAGWNAGKIWLDSIIHICIKLA